jgi:hypothetical protein
MAAAFNISCVKNIAWFYNEDFTIAKRELNGSSKSHNHLFSGSWVPVVHTAGLRFSKTNTVARDKITNTGAMSMVFGTN